MLRITVGDVMTTQVVSVARKVPSRTWLGLLVLRGVGAVPVVDRDNWVVGGVSDWIKHFAEPAEAGRSITTRERRFHRRLLDRSAEVDQHLGGLRFLPEAEREPQEN